MSVLTWPRLLMILAWWSGVAVGAESSPLLRDVTSETGITLINVSGSHEAKRVILEENGSGGALFDYDGDGDLDLYLVNGGTLEMLKGDVPPVHNALYRNDGDWRFVDVTDVAGVGDSGWGFGAAVGDYDGDGDPDLYVTNFGANVLYANQGDGRFVDVTVSAGVGESGWSHSAVFGDVDADGDLDLYVTNNLAFDPRALPNGGRPCPYRGIQVACGPIGFEPQPDRLFQNDGTGRFRDVSEAAGFHAVAPQFGLGVKMTDLDGDGRLDLYVANDSGPNFYFRNLGRAKDAATDDPVRFEEIAFLNGLATSSDGRYQAGMGVDSADLDGDGRLDVFVTNFAHDHNTLYRNVGDGLFRDDSHPSGLGGPSRLPMAWGTRFFDLDHDGLLDLYVANGHLYPEVDAGGVESFAQPDHLYLNRGTLNQGTLNQGTLNQGTVRFEEVSSRIARGAARVSRGLATGDLDGDGALDVVVVEMGSAPTVLRNEGARGGFVTIDPGRLGATVAVTVGATTHHREIARGGSYLSSSAPDAHVGLGDATRVDTVAIRWPSGKAVTLRGLPANRRYVVRQRATSPSH